MLVATVTTAGLTKEEEKAVVIETTAGAMIVAEMTVTTGTVTKITIATVAQRSRTTRATTARARRNTNTVAVVVRDLRHWDALNTGGLKMQNVKKHAYDSKVKSLEKPAPTSSTLPFSGFDCSTHGREFGAGSRARGRAPVKRYPLGYLTCTFIARAGNPIKG
eukprot:998442-Pyramimonas_sp.AAC.1